MNYESEPSSALNTCMSNSEIEVCRDSELKL